MSDSSLISADKILKDFIHASDKESADTHLTKLIQDYARPLIKQILSRKFKHKIELENSILIQQNYEDLCSDCEVRITGWLLKHKLTPNSDEIQNFNSFVAVIILNVWNDFLRQRFPRRTQLKNNIRYTLKHDSRFVIWKDDSGKIWGGLIGAASKPEDNQTVEYLLEVIRSESNTYAQDPLPVILAFIFEKKRSALTLNTLTKVIAELWKIVDLPEVSVDDLQLEGAAELNDQSFSNLIKGYKPEKIWEAIKFLPAKQRIVLLYNLKDLTGRDLLLLFFNTKIATLSELAETMCVNIEQISVILSKLPFSDKEIAGYMNLSEQKITNIRKSAKDNIKRRLEGKNKRIAAQNNDHEIKSFVRKLFNEKSKMILDGHTAEIDEYLN